MKISFYQSYWGQIGGGQRYTGLAAQVLAEQNEVEFIHHHESLDVKRLEEALELDLSKISFRFAPRPDRHQLIGSNPLKRLRQEENFCREYSEDADLFINNSDDIPIFSHCKRSVLLTHFPTVTYECFNGREGENWKNNSVFSKLAKMAYQRIEWNARFRGYEKFIVNSQFGQKWIKKRWGVTADVLYPPLRNGLQPKTKENLILVVGAYHDSEHKKQSVLLQAFIDMVSKGLDGWRLVIVGGMRDDPAARDYLASLEKSSGGYPVDILVNIPGSQLVDLFQRASIFWHAMGYEVNEASHPEHFEHFGMVATEAMAAGCVPIVFNGGGLREIVRNKTDGIRWNSIEDLTNATSSVIGNPVLRKELATSAVQRSKEFSELQFRDRIRKILGPFIG